MVSSQPSAIWLASGISSGAASSVFYASQVADVPAVFMAEPDDILVLSSKQLFKL